ncbi:MAG: Gfo/Idh/MocA family oxidoreductase [Bacteroidota bacterium]
MESVKWGIIGVGDVCEVKSAPAMNLIAGSSIEAIMRRDATKAEDYANRHGIDKWYSDADALIADPEVNAIYVATPPLAHKEYTIKAANAGKPVYVEKPMAKTHADCLEMIRTCEENNVPLFTAYYRRALPNFLKIKELILSKTIGDVRMVEVRMTKSPEPNIVTNQANHWRVDPQVAGGGYFYDLASHQLDLLDFLFGPVVKAIGYAKNQGGLYDAEDIVVGSFEFDSGVLGTGSWCFTTSPQSDREMTTIIGSKGEISFETFGDNNVILRTEEFGEQVFQFDMPKHIQQPLITQIVGELLGNGKCVSTGLSGARTNKVMELLSGQFYRVK